MLIALSILRNLAIISLFASIPLLSSAAYANATVDFGQPILAGSGCSVEASSVVLSEDKRTLSLLFDEYVASPGIKNCHLAIPVHVADGYQVKLFTVDFRGFVDGDAEFKRSYFFAGYRSKGSRFKELLSALDGKDFFLRDELTDLTDAFAECGQDVNVRINTRIRTRNKDSYISIDSLDLDRGMILTLAYQQC